MAPRTGSMGMYLSCWASAALTYFSCANTCRSQSRKRRMRAHPKRMSPVIPSLSVDLPGGETGVFIGVPADSAYPFLAGGDLGLARCRLAVEILHLLRHGIHHLES